MPRYCTTDELKAGDIVIYEGTEFQLVNCSRWANGTLFAWTTRCLDASKWPGPRHWLADWIIQGNASRRWAVKN